MKYNVAIVGATGMVGQRFISLLESHPWFNIKILAASKNSAGKLYKDAVKDRWLLSTKMPKSVENIKVIDAYDVVTIAKYADIVFCAVDMQKSDIIALEEEYARHGIAVISNNSANRMTSDVPMIIPELNCEHINIINAQRKRLNTDTGLIAVKPNCSIQSYVPALYPLLKFEPEYVNVCTYQAISGAGKTFNTWPDMYDNVIPYISGEDEKSEIEPLKIFGSIEDNKIVLNNSIKISAQCLRVNVSDGHMAACSVKFRKIPSKEEIFLEWEKFNNMASKLQLPSSPSKFINYFEDESRPQTRLDRDLGRGMAISVGRLRKDTVFDWKFVSLSHNTVRGAAGGSILTAELLAKKGYIYEKTNI